MDTKDRNPEVTYYGPEKFTIVTANVPVIERRQIRNPDFRYFASFTLEVEAGVVNITPDSKVEVKIDNRVIIKTEDFIANGRTVTKPIPALRPRSVLGVFISGAKDSFIKVTIRGTLKSNVITDVEGNYYFTVQIGTQTWMAENLKTTKYNDGVHIIHVEDNDDWNDLIFPYGIPTTVYHIGGYCWYNNDIANKNVYGALYNWSAVHMGKLAPAGWHVPTHPDYVALSSFVSGGNAGGKLKETGTAHWLTPNLDATDAFGFTALPGGQRDPDGIFHFIGELGTFWLNSVGGADIADFFSLSHHDNMLKLYKNRMNTGYSIRCIKD